MKIKMIVYLGIASCISLNASYIDPKELAKKLHLSPGTKAAIQWKRVFSIKRKMKRYGIDKLSKKQREVLEKYLIDHAIDSDHPEMAGNF